MPHRIRRDVARPSAELVEFFTDQTAADVHEAMGRSGAMDADIGPVAGPPTLCGPAVTAHVPPGDNTMVHVAANVAKQGDILIFGSDDTETATWGELATRNALRKEVAGVVSDGNVRDTEAIDDLGFSVFSRAVSQRGARKAGNGSVNVPVAVGGVVVNPGDIVIGDPDGVTVVPREVAAEVKDATAEKRRREDRLRERIDDGASLYELIDIDSVLDAVE